MPFSMEVLMGKSSINGPFSMAMLNNQKVNPNSSRPRRHEHHGVLGAAGYSLGRAVQQHLLGLMLVLLVEEFAGQSENVG